MKKIIMMAVMTALTFHASAQDKVEVSVRADMVSNYIWRGDKISEAAIQPTLGVSYKGFSFSAFGSYALMGSNQNKEIDLTAAYKIGSFEVGVNDYFCVDDDTPYFFYKAGETSHVFEAFASYDFGLLSLLWGANFAGADARNENGKPVHTSYIEVSAPFNLGGLNWRATLGVVPYGAKYQYYATVAEGFAVTNVGLKASKNLQITPTFKLPIFAEMIGNPSTRKLYFIFGFTLQP